MATAAHARGQGIGAAVLAALVGTRSGRGRRGSGAAPASGALAVRARRFRVTSEEFEVLGIGPHYVMELTLA